MSATTGDKARYGRQRKRKLARREHTREMRAKLQAEKPAAVAAPAKKEEAPAQAV